eukprot:gb/GECH01011454.1/.p1 GENE.gb/GECH01011454.1/~~gb/GECH01011454.1/.p1  ORF type:complete len:1020 (+),score=161.33 gb/GECH01011454.1/:1-3060(+)
MLAYVSILQGSHKAGISYALATLVYTVILVFICATTTYTQETQTNFHFKEENKQKQNNEYIVMFREYHLISTHTSVLSSILGTEHGFKIIPRNNPATKYPSDFALVQFQNNTQLSLLKDQYSPIIKRVIPNKRIRINSPQSFQTPNTTQFSQDLKQRSLLSLLQPNSHGRLQTRWSQDYFPMDNETESDSFLINGSASRRRLLGNSNIAERLNAREMWNQGYTGRNVKVAVFDTGLNKQHPAFARGEGSRQWTNVEEVINYTSESSTEDYHGHGTFVAGVIGANSLTRNPRCGGIAPESRLYIFKVFTVDQSSYTSWFLDAFNYALVSGVDVLNLSIGGPDYKDMPFVEKVWELSANNIIVVSAIGNDGPLYGTLNNPADQFDVIGVGGMDNSNQVAYFSSRGVTTWEIPYGYGRVKPDIVTYGSHLQGPGLSGGCRTLSGTSVASPVVTGAVALLISSVPEEVRSSVVNPASIKHVLTHSAQRLPSANMFEQGMGRLDLVAAYRMLQDLYVAKYIDTRTASNNATNSHGNDPYLEIQVEDNEEENKHLNKVDSFSSDPVEPSSRYNIAFVPRELDATQCPYNWPYCEQPIYYTSQPLIVNATLLNPMGKHGHVLGAPRWIPHSTKDQSILNVTFTYSDVFWPWSGHVSAFISVTPEGQNFKGTINGHFEVEIQSPPEEGETESRRGIGRFNITVNVIPPPPSWKRVLWDQRHNLQYPIDGYIPRDNLNIKHDILDWNGDHPHTNFRGLFQDLHHNGYFVEILISDFTDIDLSQYGTLIIADPEAEFTEDEIEVFGKAVNEQGLSVAIFGDWYNYEVIRRISFWDDNTESQWVPVTGGSNVPALNRLLDQFGIKFGDRIYDGVCQIKDYSFKFASGTSIIRFPSERAKIYKQDGLRDQTAQILRQRVSANIQPVVLGLYQTLSGGRIVVYGDSNCIDAVHNGDMCYRLLNDIMRYTGRGRIEGLLAVATDSDGVYVDPGTLLVQGQYMFPIILSAGLLLVLIILFVRTRRLHRGITQTV